MTSRSFRGHCSSWPGRRRRSRPPRERGPFVMRTPRSRSLRRASCSAANRNARPRRAGRRPSVRRPRGAPAQLAARHGRRARSSNGQRSVIRASPPAHPMAEREILARPPSAQPCSRESVPTPGVSTCWQSAAATDVARAAFTPVAASFDPVRTSRWRLVATAAANRSALASRAGARP